MSAGFTHAVADGLRYNGVQVSFEPGYLTRGNGYSFPDGRPRGLLIHHTGSRIDTGLSTLVNGRPDLGPPLCNTCGYGDGRVHFLAAHVANHAGASGGPDMGPLLVTRLFNPQVWGHEIMFPGLTEMTPAQYRSAQILGGVICGILGVDVEHVRAHANTSKTGKWDPGRGDGTTNPIDMRRFRGGIWDALTLGTTGVDDMSAAGTHKVGAEPETFELAMPVGSASGLVHTGWLGVSLSKGGSVVVEAYRGRGDLMDRWGRDVVPHERMWKELPSGAETYSVTVDSAQAGSVGWCFELRPRKDTAR